MNTLDVILWAFLGTYIVHVIDETVVGDGFTKLVQRWFWPQYHIEMFFWFNTACIVLIALCIALFDVYGGHWVVLALMWPFGFALHGITVHVWWTARTKQYFSGLLTSPLYWIILYLIIRYAYLPGLIATNDFLWSAVVGIGVIGGFLTFAPTYIFPVLLRRKEKS